MKKVAILGAGYTIKPMVDYFIEKCKYEVVMATRTISKAEKVLAGRPLGTAIAWTTNQLDKLDEIVKNSDIVIVMIPRSGHYIVADACIKYGVPMITTDFMHEGILAYDEKAKNNNTFILTELGEDPGLDNMGAKQMIDEIRAEGGKIINLTSYGAGLPSFEHNRNPFGYKFSWDPKGLMRSAVSPAASVVNGKKIDIPAKFEKNRLVDVYGIGTFETYPSNDSSRYISLFGLESDITIYKGLLRFIGWCNTITKLLKLKIIENTTELNLTNLTYAQFMVNLIGAKTAENIKAQVASFMDLEERDDFIERLNWLGLFSDRLIPTPTGTCSDVLVDIMLEKMSYAPYEKDLIIVHNEIIVEFADRKEKRISSMINEGIPYGDTAMARAVALPAAIAARLILEGKIAGSGVHCPLTPEMYNPILDEMSEYGFTFTKTTLKL